VPDHNRNRRRTQQLYTLAISTCRRWSGCETAPTPPSAARTGGIAGLARTEWPTSGGAAAYHQSLPSTDVLVVEVRDDNRGLRSVQVHDPQTTHPVRRDSRRPAGVYGTARPGPGRDQERQGKHGENGQDERERQGFPHEIHLPGEHAHGARHGSHQCKLARATPTTAATNPASQKRRTTSTSFMPPNSKWW